MNLNEEALESEHKDSKSTKNEAKSPDKSGDSQNIPYNLENVQNQESANPDNFQDKITNTNEDNLNVKENNSYICDHCGKDFEGKSELIAHIIAYSVTGGASKTNLDISRPTFSSSPSTSKCSTKSQLINQDIQPLDLKLNYISCDQCDFKTTKKCYLRKHIRVHSDLRPYMCTECGAKFKRSTSLTVHMRSHTGNRPYECNVCDAKFTTNSKLKVHQRTHTGEKPSECTACDAKFNTNSELKVHQRIHSGEKLYECTECDAKFNTKSNLTVHLRFHRGDKPHQCTVCASKFTTTSNLNVHLRIHSGEKPYECTICDAKFNQSQLLKSHMRVHSEKKP